jgi:hypothetical protein
MNDNAEEIVGALDAYLDERERREDGDLPGHARDTLIECIALALEAAVRRATEP